MRSFDLAVIGSGPGGYRAAVLGALHGLSVAIVEKGQWGGCCLNRGCVPKKTWHHSAKLMQDARHWSGRGLAGTLSADLELAWHHQKQVVQTVRDSSVRYLRRLGIALWEGEASLVGPHELAVGGTPAMRARHILIATGSHPHVPAVFRGHPDVILTTDDLFDRLPPHGPRVAVVGSGAVGTEFAFILAMLGRRVTWLAAEQPLGSTAFSQAARKLLSDALAQGGITPRLGTRIMSIERTAGGILLQTAAGTREEVDWVLLGTGRVPHTRGLALDPWGVALDPSGFIPTNEALQTRLPHVYAIGDVANPRMTANHALAEASIALANILRPAARSRANHAVPRVIHSAVELASVGLSEDQAEEEGFETAVGFAAFATNPRALGQDAPEGFVRLVADADSGKLLGAEVAGNEAGELIHWVAGQLGRADALQQLSGAFYNHPSRSEELQNAAETLAAKWGLHDAMRGPH
ncbi:MAG: NAD(P)/FAD-dependent oxidoreductase [Betaproteobacteria bacterium]|nr:NAD(P)/FAD-dependent oxidoreductase [Betaproteobacteria bacterium]